MCASTKSEVNTALDLAGFKKKKNGVVISAMMAVKTIGFSWWAEPSGSLTRTRIPFTGAKRNLQKGNY